MKTKPSEVIILEEVGNVVVIGFMNASGRMEYNKYEHMDGGEIDCSTDPTRELMEMEGLPDETEVLLDNLPLC